MRSVSPAWRRPLNAAQLHSIFQHTLSLGSDMDGRGLHWRLPITVHPAQRLAFALAVYFSGGLYVLIDAGRGFLCVEKIALALAQLKQARHSGGSYLCGHAYARLHEALGYPAHDSSGFALIEAADVVSVEGFIKGYGDRMAQSLEADVLHIVSAAPRAAVNTQLVLLRHFIGDRLTLDTVLEQLL